MLFLKDHPAAKSWHDKLVGRYGKAKALSIMAQKLRRRRLLHAQKKGAFDPKRFFQEQI